MKKVQVLGTGCKKCSQLHANAQEALKALGSEVFVEKVTDLSEIMTFGVIVTPALAVDGKVVVSGKVPGVDELKAKLAQDG